MRIKVINLTMVEPYISATEGNRISTFERDSPSGSKTSKFINFSESLPKNFRF